MQGVFLNGARPKSKKQVREAVAAGQRVRIEATSWFGDEYDGPLDGYEGTKPIYFVGPDPYTKRSFYGQITRGKDGAWVVK